MRVARVTRLSVVALIAGLLTPLGAANADPPPPLPYALVDSVVGPPDGSITVTGEGHLDPMADPTDAIAGLELLVDGTVSGAPYGCAPLVTTTPYDCTDATFPARRRLVERGVAQHPDPDGRHQWRRPGRQRAGDPGRPGAADRGVQLAADHSGRHRPLQRHRHRRPGLDHRPAGLAPAAGRWPPLWHGVRLCAYSQRLHDNARLGLHRAAGRPLDRGPIHHRQRLRRLCADLGHCQQPGAARRHHGTQLRRRPPWHGHHLGDRQRPTAIRPTARGP